MGIVEAAVQTKQQGQGRRRWELWLRSEPAVGAVELFRELAEGRAKLVLADRERLAWVLLFPEMCHQLRGRLEQLFPVLTPRFRDAGQQGRKSRSTVAVFGREVRTGEDRFEIRRDEHRHRPPPLAVVHRDGRRHVDIVQIGTFLTVDFDIDEVLVHDRGDSFILEGLPLHDVAPVARRVANGQQNQLVFAAGALQGLGTPGVPLYGIVGVLEQIGTGFVNQSVGVFGVGGRGHPSAVCGCDRLGFSGSVECYHGNCKVRLEELLQGF